MMTSPPGNTVLSKASAVLLHAGSNILRTPTMKADADAILFSVKSFAAAMLAYYIALRIGLPKPFWAIVTVYIVSQTSAGASLSRGVYRFAGTGIGAIATVIIVPNFVNDPIVCSMVLSGWIGLCLFCSLLDRTPRAYAFVLAGYTASLIGFPSVLDPGSVFDTASLRVQEISIGIFCAVLVHRYILPKRMTGQFTGKLSVTLRDARRLAGDALNGEPDKNRRDRSQLAADLLALQGLATYLPYDAAPATPRRETLRLMHDRLARLLPLATEIEDRIHSLGISHDNVPDELIALVADVGTWIATLGTNPQERSAVQLIDRARSMQKQFGADATTSVEQLVANLAGHLAEMAGLLQDCDRLERTIAARGRSRVVTSLHGPTHAKGYVYHRDPWMAGHAALGAMIGILLGCAFWIGSAWPDGGTAVSILGVCCALFGNVDAPAPNVVKYIVGSLYGVIISFAYSFVILPQVTDFAVLVAVLAPAFLFAGSLQARPATTYMALGITLTIPILSNLGAQYTGDFATALNTAVALFAGIGFGAVSMSLFQTVPVDVAIRRLLYLNRRDVGRRALGAAPNEAHWTSLMIDRTALLLPRLRASRVNDMSVFDNTLDHLRIGHAVGQLRKMRPLVKDEAGIKMSELLSAVATVFHAGRPLTPADLTDFEQRIMTLMTMMAGSPLQNSVRTLDLLIDLRFALGIREMAVGRTNNV